MDNGSPKGSALAMAAAVTLLAALDKHKGSISTDRTDVGMECIEGKGELLCSLLFFLVG